MMGFASGGILLRRSWVLDQYGLLEALGGVETSRDSLQRVPLKKIHSRFEGVALAFVGEWTCVFDASTVFDAVLQASERRRAIEATCLDLAPEALLWLCETYGDSFGFVHLTESSRRARRFVDGRWELDLGAPLPFEAKLSDPAHGETVVGAAIEACLGRHPNELASDPRLRATVFRR